MTMTKNHWLVAAGFILAVVSFGVGTFSNALSSAASLGARMGSLEERLVAMQSTIMLVKVAADEAKAAAALQASTISADKQAREDLSSIVSDMDQKRRDDIKSLEERIMKRFDSTDIGQRAIETKIDRHIEGAVRKDSMVWFDLQDFE